MSNTKKVLTYREFLSFCMRNKCWHAFCKAEKFYSVQDLTVSELLAKFDTNIFLKSFSWRTNPSKNWVDIDHALQAEYRNSNEVI